MKKSFLFLTLSMLIGAMFFGLAVWKAGLLTIILVLTSLTFWQFLAILALTVLIIFLWYWRWRLILAYYNEPVDFGTLIQATLAGYAVSSLTPAAGLGGEPAQYILVKNKYQAISSSNLSASIVIDKVFYATINFLVTLFGIVIFLFAFSVSVNLRIVLISALLILFVLGLLFFIRAFKRKGILSSLLSFLEIKRGNGFLKRVKEVESAVHRFFYFKNPHLWGLFILSLIRAGVYTFRFYLIVLFLGENLLFKEIIVVTGAIFLLGLLPIPSGLGTFEFSQAFIFSAFGFPPSAGVTMILLSRVFDWGLALFGFLILLNKSMKRFWPFFNQVG